VDGEQQAASHAWFAAVWLVLIVNNFFLARFVLYLEAADAHYRYTLLAIIALGNNVVYTPATIMPGHADPRLCTPGTGALDILSALPVTTGCAQALRDGPNKLAAAQPIQQPIGILMLFAAFWYFDIAPGLTFTYHYLPSYVPYVWGSTCLMLVVASTKAAAMITTDHVSQATERLREVSRQSIPNFDETMSELSNIFEFTIPHCHRGCNMIIVSSCHLFLFWLAW
jgi:hypothetical protein